MKFELKTLVDITETGARRGEDIHKYNQQQNFLTLYQTISLRANPIVKQSPVISTENISNYGFGKKYKNKQNIWTFVYEFENDEQHSIEMMKQDFDFVPFITGLDETVKFQVSTFVTDNDDFTNIIFSCIGK